MKYDCPVCGYPEMADPPRNHEICPCCGTEFALDDYERKHEQLREEWIAQGARWFSKETPQPPNWSALEQLTNAEMLPYYVHATGEKEAVKVRPVVLDLTKKKPGKFQIVSE